MRHRALFLALLLLPFTGCASDRASKSDLCKIYKFEDDVAVKIRTEAVGELSSRLESGAPRDIISMKIILPRSAEFAPKVKPASVQLSAFFRPLADGQMVCNTFTEVGKRCYVRIPDQPLQLSAIFDVKVTDSDASLGMNTIIDQVITSVLDCK